MFERLFPQPYRLLFVIGLAHLIYYGPLMLIRADEEHPVPVAAQPAGVERDLRIPSAAELEQLITDLGSSDYQTRENATETLAQCSPEIVPHLKAAARGDDLEVTLRVVQVLEQMYEQAAKHWFKLLRQSNPRVGERSRPVYAEHPIRTARLERAAWDFDQVDSALSELGENPAPSLSRRALLVLQDYRLQREFKAMLDVLDLGGRLFHLSSASGGQDLVFITKEMILGGYQWDGEFGIQIDRNWHHTQDALDKVKRITRLQSVYLIKGAPLTRDELIQLQVALPQIRLQTRGAARLGVMHGNALIGPGNGAPVGDVTRDSGAEKAGIKNGDTIVRLGEFEITDFESLVRSLENYDAGDVVEVDVLRGIEKLTLEVELGGW